MDRGGKAERLTMSRKWKRWELEYLKEHAGDGAKAIAERIGRSQRAVEVMASRERISLCRSWYCPKCGKTVYEPLTSWSGWCRRCSIEASKIRAADKCRRVKAELAAERRLIEKAEKERQAIYSETNRKLKELRRLRESREVNEKEA